MEKFSDGAETGSEGGEEIVEEIVEVGTDDWIPRSRFNEINNRNKANEAELERLRKEQEKAKRAVEESKTASLKEQNKFKELYEAEAQKIAELASYKEKYEEILVSTREANEARIKGLPAQYRGLVPEYENPLKLSKWLDANLSILTGVSSAPKLDGGAGSGARTGKDAPNVPSEEWVISQAQKLGVDPKLFGRQYGVNLS